MSNSGNSREIEKKWKLQGETLGSVSKALLNSCGYHEVKLDLILDCQTSDYYWSLGQDRFLRLRDSWGLTSDGFSRVLKEVTLKKKDRGSNVDRLEYNLGISDSQTAYKIYTEVHGEPVGEITKKEFIVFTRDGAIISVAEIEGDLYLEVEAKNESQVDQYAHFLLQPFKYSWEERSLFEIYIREAA